MAEGGIYEIVNLVNDKRYVGSAINFRRRWRQHKRLLEMGVHHSRYLQFAWNKYGGDAFDFRVLWECEAESLISLEQVAIDSLRPEYNISQTAGSTLGVKYTEEARARIAAANKGKLKGRKRCPEAVALTAAAHRGMKRSAETKAKIAARALGRPFVRFNDDYRKKLSAALKGRMPSAEHMAALQAGRRAHLDTPDQRAAKSEKMRLAYAEGRKSRERSPEYREKIAASLRGRKATPEHRANQSAAQRGKKRGPYKKRVSHS